MSLEFVHVFSLRSKYLYPFARPSLHHHRLWYRLTSGSRYGGGVRMEQNSLSKFLPWPGFEPRTSSLAVQHTTARSLRTHTIPTVNKTPKTMVLGARRDLDTAQNGKNIWNQCTSTSRMPHVITINNIANIQQDGAHHHSTKVVKSWLMQNHIPLWFG